MNDKKTTEVEQKTGIHIKQGLGIALVFVFSALIAGFAFLPSILKKESISIITVGTSNVNSVPVPADSTPSPLPTNALSETEYAALLNEANQNTVLAEDVSVKITNPLEGDIVSGSDDEWIKAELTDPNKKVSGVRFELYNDDYHVVMFLKKVNSPPYQAQSTLKYYKSGVYRYVVKAIGLDASVLATHEIWVTLAHSCYHALPSFSFDSPEGTVINVAPGESFTLTGKVTNNCRGQCPDLFYLLQNDFGQNVAPAGWTYNITPATCGGTLCYTDISERSSLNITVKVTVPSNAANGQYEYPITARWDNSGFQAADRVTVKVKITGTGGIEPTPVISE